MKLINNINETKLLLAEKDDSYPPGSYILVRKEMQGKYNLYAFKIKGSNDQGDKTMAFIDKTATIFRVKYDQNAGNYTVVPVMAPGGKIPGSLVLNSKSGLTPIHWLTKDHKNPKAMVLDPAVKYELDKLHNINFQ